MMKAIRVDEFVKDFHELKIQDVCIPTLDADPGHRSVIVKVTHSGITAVDGLYAKGLHQNVGEKGHVRRPFTLGIEFAGIVTSTSPSSQFKPGDRVFGGGLGAYAEYIRVEDSALQKIPEIWSNDEASFMTGGPTAYGALISTAKLKAGETVLILGSGGLALVAIQIAKAIGAHVICVVRNRKKAELVRGLGADHSVNYHEPQWESKVRALTHDGEGVDVVYDDVGAVESGIRCLRYNGRLVIVGFAGRGGKMEKLAMNRILLKSVVVYGYRAGETGRRDPQHKKEIWEGFVALAEAGGIKPVIYNEKKYRGLSDVPQALEDVRTGETWGRVVVEIDEEAGKARL